MVFRVTVFVKDPDAVFDWTRKNLAADNLVRQIAKGVDYEVTKAGAFTSTCSPDNLGFGWVVQIVVKNRESANRIVSVLKPQVDHCYLVTIGT
jgi:hypothetical protein